ncbi:MAG TPA: ABC transporter permease [Chryseosolibacter sp.]
MTNTNRIPPKLATWFLQTFLRDDLFEEVSGDLHEKFQKTLENKSLLKAQLNYWRQVVNYVRPFAIRRIDYRNQNQLSMYGSYFTSSLRNMKKNKLHAFINIAGLTVGLAVAMVIGLWLKDELSYEKHFANYEKAGLILQHVTNNGGVETWWSVPMPLAEELRKNYGDNFEHVVLMTSPDQELLNFNDKNFSRTGIFAEAGFPHLFSLDMVHGTRNALTDQSSILVSASTAKMLFGDDNPVGKVVIINKEMTVSVAGVYRDIPRQSEFYGLHFVAPWDLLYAHTPWIQNMRDPWRPNAFSLYVTLADNKTFEHVNASIRDAKLKKVSPELAKKKPALFVHPMKNWRLYSAFRNGMPDGGRITYVWLFGVIGVFVVIMACINFMNLSTARSEKRSKEVGIRKAIGSLRSQLVQQFFTESVLTAMFALVLALGLVQLTLPLFNQLADKQTTLPWTNMTYWGVAIALCIFIGLVAGSYPALYLSSIRPGTALKGSYKAGKSASLPRKILVVVQFTVSVVLIIGTLVVFKQIQHAKNRPIGYDTNGLIAIPNNAWLHNNIDVIKDQLENAGIISEIGESDAPTTELWGSSSAFDWDGKDPDLSVDFPNTRVSHTYGRTIGWEIVQGRDFDRKLASDSVALIINEAAARYIGFDNPVGKTIRWYSQPFQVIGVVKDIVVRSPYDPIRPTIYALNEDSGNFLLMRLKRDIPMSDALSQIETVFKKFTPNEPFTFRFMDEEYARKFGNEERVGKLAGVFTTLAIFISCLGIFGLSSFTAEQRTKEISIRKVHGASNLRLWTLMSTDFVMLVGVACVVAVPIAYQLLTSWLKRYEYRVDVTWTVFAAAAVATLVITLATISWHTLQAARANPVKSLRSE